VGDSLRFLRGNHRAVARLLRPGGYRPDAVLRELGEGARKGRCEIAGLHVYTFNRVEPTVSHYEALRRRASDEEEDAA
jgi:methylenetetrahydrofolate reductase (NADPH)